MTPRARSAPSRWRDLPIIAMTANAMAGDRERALAAGMNDHIAKPIQVDAMFDTLRRWLGPVMAHEPSEAASAPSAPPGLETLVLPGIDIARGRQRVPERLFLRLLKLFRDGERDFPARYAAAWHGGDRAAATRMAHTLASTAGTLGATSLYEAARALENAQSADTMDAPLAQVRAHLAEVIGGLDASAALG